MTLSEWINRLGLFKRTRALLDRVEALDVEVEVLRGDHTESIRTVALSVANLTSAVDSLTDKAHTHRPPKVSSVGAIDLTLSADLNIGEQDG